MLGEQVSYGTASNFDESFVPPLPAIQNDAGQKYSRDGALSGRPIQVTALLWSLMARKYACSKLLVEVGAAKDLVHFFVSSEGFVQYSANHRPQNLARSIQQDLIEECVDYKYYGPFQATLEAKRDVTDATKKPDDRYAESLGSVAAHRRVQAVAVDVGWHDRALKEVKFLTGMSKRQLEDAYIWQGRPRSGTTFFMVNFVPSPFVASLPPLSLLSGVARRCTGADGQRPRSQVLRADEFVEGMELAIGDESVLALRILVQVSTVTCGNTPLVLLRHTLLEF